MSRQDDYRYMARAIQLANKGRYTTHPNPRVGCLIVKHGEVVGEGYHRYAGEPHAERNALVMAGARAQGASAYVTLEPCCHQGRTPPCTEGLIEAGVSRVVAAMQDPNPLVAGEGLAELAAAGIQVDSGLLQAEAERLNPGFIKRMRSGLPYVRCKLAMSLDGRTAMASGESKWISSADSRRDVHRLRAGSSAILTGIGTILADDPSMDVRLTPSELELDEHLRIPAPLRVVLDPDLSMPLTAGMLQRPGETLVVTGTDNPRKTAALQKAGAEVVRVAHAANQLDLQEVMRVLAAQEINEVLLETGATLAGGMLVAGLIDEIILYLAPHIMGHGARGLFHLPGLERMAERHQLQIDDVRLIGQDIRITASPLDRY
ncbi:MAG: bifunctional diaminohydroxyphosphoribosylaminopyrimidine deaminase/5-amino-6-(5-phosphoribosylamino)uracil reductase RibD [Gammaproteobacteria bacterium]|nr:bifunctional diaminohydroxyphosphoribosylaminopyrimidine deaminase/5-amino-6-(5-phosphoribosylamino)uracil reductase RibD [Gammaproteobacteria bacterium]